MNVGQDSLDITTESLAERVNRARAISGLGIFTYNYTTYLDLFFMLFRSIFHSGKPHGVRSYKCLSLTNKFHNIALNSNSTGGGQDRPCDAKFCEKCPYSHNNNTAAIKQPN